MVRETGGPAYAVEPSPQVVLPIVGSTQLFPVHRIYCVGRNYADHAIEMGGDPNREPPFFFQKNPDNLVRDGRFPYPLASTSVHHEIELVVALGRGGTAIPVDHALRCVFGYAVGIDMTRRDLQDTAKDLRRPWEVAKAFEASAPCGPLQSAGTIGHPSAGAITLDVNGQQRQAGDLGQMIWKVPEIIATLSGLFALKPGDLIFTGTPAGVGAVARGDTMRGHIDAVGDIEVHVV
jgi:fumarylpyruvate hydrolase